MKEGCMEASSVGSEPRGTYKRFLLFCVTKVLAKIFLTKLYVGNILCYYVMTTMNTTHDSIRFWFFVQSYFFLILIDSVQCNLR